MEIVDSQIHRPLPLVPWDLALSNEAKVVADIELAIAAMEAVGVDAAITYSSEEYCTAAANRHPNKFVGALSFYNPNELNNVDVDAFCAGLRSRGILGFRVLPGRPPFKPENLAFLTEGFWEPLFTAAEKHQIPAVVYIPLHLKLVRGIVKSHPDLRVIIDHLGMGVPPASPLTENMFGLLPDLLELADLPTVAVKFSAVPSLSTAAYPFKNLWPYLHKILEAFGPDRLMWGSDFTRVTGRWVHPRHPGGRLTYAELLNFLKYTNEVSEADKELMFSGAVRHWFRWPKPE